MLFNSSIDNFEKFYKEYCNSNIDELQRYIKEKNIDSAIGEKIEKRYEQLKESEKVI